VAKQFDATLKQLVDAYAADWLTFLRPRLGLPPGTAFEPLDADLSTVSPQADKLFRLTGPVAGLIHLELQSSADVELPDRLLLYNVLAAHRHGGPVQTVVLLLRREANATTITGTLLRHLTDGRQYHEFRYDVVRLWDLPAEELLAGPLGTLPLAALTDEAAATLPVVFSQIDARFAHEAGAAAGTLRAALYVLLGLRYDRRQIDQLYRGVVGMEESVTYQAILEKGAIAGEARGRREEALRLIRLFGRKKLGPLDPSTESVLVSIENLGRLERIAERIPDAASWADLLATP
jgi:predicted transposase YdaD